MSIPKPPEPAKLVAGVFLKDKSLFEKTVQKLTAIFGDVDIISPWFDFNYTSYYEAEMGSPLVRRLIVFKDLVKQNQLPDIKIRTNAVEKEFSSSDRRNINIDPGYMTAQRFVLATGKNFPHRIYLNKGIYADLTLIYKKGGFEFQPWTYPDYRDKALTDFLILVRKKYMQDVKQTHSSSNEMRTEDFL